MPKSIETGLHPGFGFLPLRFGIFDRDAATFFAAIENDGHTLWDAEKTMINNVIRSLKSSGLWNLMTLLWIPVGPNLDSALRAIKHPNGIGTKMINVDNQFIETDWDRRSGLTSRNNLNACRIETLTTPVAYAPGDDTHMCLVSEDAGAAPAGERDMGDFNNVGAFEFILLFRTVGFLGAFYRPNGVSSGFEDANTSAPALGIWIGTRTGPQAAIYRDNIIIGSTTGLAPAGAPSTGSVTIFAASNGYANKRFSAASIGKGLSAANANGYHSILSTLRSERAALIAN